MVERDCLRKKVIDDRVNFGLGMFGGGNAAFGGESCKGEGKKKAQRYHYLQFFDKWAHVDDFLDESIS